MAGKFLMVIPPVAKMVNGRAELEIDFCNNLRAYLANFDHVTVACPLSPGGPGSGILFTESLDEFNQTGKFTFIALPSPYREDRYYRNLLAMRKLLRAAISEADYVSFTPHAKYDWSIRGALEAIKLDRKFNVESDGIHEDGCRMMLAKLSPGPNKLRKMYLSGSFIRELHYIYSKSSLALFQGQEVYEAYEKLAPNPQKVLNVQIRPEDRITAEQLARKIDHISSGRPLKISYAGRALVQKGPLDWVKTIGEVVARGGKIQAAWYGDGLLLPQMLEEAERHGIAEFVKLPGVVPRAVVSESMKDTDVFLFCHTSGESPRCLTEALAAGSPLVGYGSAFPRDLVATKGGGEFVERGDWQALANTVMTLDRDRTKLVALVRAAAESGRILDRDTAIQHRIDLIKKYL